MIGSTPQIPGEETKTNNETKKDQTESENKEEHNDQNENKPEEKIPEKKQEEKPKKKSNFSFIKKKGATSDNNNSSNINKNNNNEENKNYKSPTNDSDLSKLMEATSHPSSTSPTKNLSNSGNFTPISLNTNTTSKPKTGFGFIKKSATPKIQNEEKKENIQQFQPTKIETNIQQPPKKLQNILIVYKNKLEQYHGKMFNYNEDIKGFLRKFTGIRKEISDLNEAMKNNKDEINNLVKNQNEQIELNNFDMAEKLEEEIKLANNKLEDTKLLIRQKNENELTKIKLTLVDLIKQKNEFYDSYLISFIPLLENANASLEEAENEKKISLNKIQEDINKIEKKEVEEKFNEASKEFEEEQKKIDEQYEEETKDITSEINTLNDKSNSIKDEIEELKNKIKEKEQELLNIDNDIQNKIKEK